MGHPVEPSEVNHVRTPLECQETTDDNDHGPLLDVLNNGKLKEPKEDTIEKVEVKKTDCDASEKDMKCNFCEETFKDTTSYYSHRAIHKAKGLLDPVEIPCEVCEESFNTFEQMKMHMKTCKKPFMKCDFCEKTFKDKPSYLTHKRIHKENDKKHGPVEIPCGLCEQSFGTFEEMRIHMKTCNKPQKPLIDCEFCEKKFKNRKEKLAHKKEIHFSGTLCPECGIQCRSTVQLRNHRESEHGISLEKENKGLRINCEECGKSIIKYYKKKHFERWHSPDEKLPCDQCNKTFVNKKCLKDHQESSHITDICSLCGKQILRKTMIQHIDRMHSEDQPKQFRCEVCKKGFHNYAVYKYHSVIHTGEKPNVCEYCGKGFAQSKNLEGHIKGVHFGIKRPSRSSSKHLNSVQENPIKQ